jgi:hypothetical protein
MKKLPEIDGILEHFRMSEGGNIRLDEPAILQEYEAANANRSGIAIKVLTVTGGFLVTFAFLGFLMVAGLYDSGTGMLFSGIIFLAGALIVKKIYDLLILDTFAVSFYVCGCLLLLLATWEFRMEKDPVCIGFMVIGLVSLLIIQSYMMAFAAICIFHAAAITLFLPSSYPSSGFTNMYPALLIWGFTFWLLEEARIIRWSAKLSRLYNPVRMGTLAAILASAWLNGNGWFLSIHSMNWLTVLAAASSLLLLLPRILQTLGIQTMPAKLPAYAATILALAPTIWAPGIAVALLVILLCFHVNFKTGVVAGIIALIWLVSEFYYNLQMTLLIKSLLMMGTGIFFLLLYFLTPSKKVAP